MGKNSAVRTLGRRIGNVVLHMLLSRYTNRPESISHLEREEATYRDSAIKDAKQYHWNDEDRKALQQEALAFIEQKAITKYSDVKIPLDEAKALIEAEIKDLGI